MKNKRINNKTVHTYQDGAWLTALQNFGGMNSLTKDQLNTVTGLTGAAQAALSGLSNGVSTTGGSVLKGVGAGLTAVNPILGLATSAVGMLADQFGSNVNTEAVTSAKNTISSLGSNLSNATSYEDLENAMQQANQFNLDDYDLGTQGWFNNDVTNAKNSLQSQLNSAMRNYQVSAANIATNQNRIDRNNALAEGGNIYIKPSKRGTFTAAAKKRGMDVQEFASKVLANKEDYSPAMVKKANFARNASKWHADGGMLFDDNFSNGVVEVNNGSTHEANPNGGVPMGVAPDGLNNLVEQGETIYNDYVFSDRLKVPKNIKEMYKLKDNIKTYSDAFKALEKESKERPNDPISKNGLDVIAAELMQAQEAQRIKEQSNKFAKGGHMFPYPNISNNFSGFLEYDNTGNQGTVVNAINKLSPIGQIAAQVAGSKNTEPSERTKNLSWLRYAEPLANLGAVTTDILGITNTPTTYDYIPEYQDVSYNPLGDYLTYNPYDINYVANRQAAQAAATRRALSQSNVPNRNAAILAADYNAVSNLGDAYRQAQEYNQAQREKVATFNRATNQANAQMALQAAQANATNRLNYSNALLQQARLNEESSNTASAAKAMNIGNLAESIANIGRESDARARVNALVENGVPLNEAMKTVYGIKACGGKIKNKRGLTY